MNSPRDVVAFAIVLVVVAAVSSVWGGAYERVQQTRSRGRVHGGCSEHTEESHDHSGVPHVLEAW